MLLRLTSAAPWPGPSAYAEDDAGFFHGRDAEKAELHRLVQAEPVSVLYSLSGLGKTSLLQAGLFPRLRSEGWLPVHIRLDHRDKDDDGSPVPPLTAQILVLLAQAARDSGVTVPAWQADTDTLVAGLHERGERFWGTSEDEPVTPVLVFDQFEECWTQTRDYPQARARAESLLGQLAELLEWRGNDRHSPAPLRIVFSLREDQLAPLDALRPLFPSLRRARLRLLPFNAAQARQVVEKSGAHLLEDNAVEVVVDTFAATDAERPVADPALLSIFCWRLNEDRRTRGEDAMISPARVKAMRGEFVQQFYDDAFAALPEDQQEFARLFVENDLIDAAGFRTSAGFEHAREKYKVTRPALETLVNARLLHPVDRSGGHSHVELVHDRIAEEAQKRRLAREEAEALAKDSAEKNRLKAELKRTDRLANIFATLFTACLIALAFAGYMYYKASKAERAAVNAKAEADTATRDAFKARERSLEAEQGAVTANEQTKKALADANRQTVEAEKQRAAAEDASKKMQAALAEATQQKQEAEKQRAAAEEANKKTQTALAEATQQKQEAEKQRAAAEAEKTRTEQAREKVIAAKNSADELLSFLQFDLRDTLSQSGRLDLMKSISERVEQYLKNHPPGKEEAYSASTHAVRFETQGVILFAQRDLVGAKAAFEKACAVVEDAVKQSPDSDNWRSNLSVILSHLGNVQAALGDKKAALEYFRKRNAICADLAKRQPSNQEVQHSLLTSERDLGLAFTAVGDFLSALDHQRASHTIAERQARQEPNNEAYQSDLSYSHENVANALHDLHQGPTALEHYRQGTNIIERLVQAHPENLGWQEQLAANYLGFTNLLNRDKDDKTIKDSLAKAAEIVARAIQQQPNDPHILSKLAIGETKLGDAAAASNRSKVATRHYLNGIAIYERLSAQDPDNAGYQSNLAMIYQKLGATTPIRGIPKIAYNGKATLEYFQKCLVIRESLVKRFPTSPVYQNDVGGTHILFGIAHAICYDHAAAMKSYQKATTILLTLARQHPANIAIQENLLAAYAKTAVVLEQQRVYADALASAEAALKIHEKLVALEPASEERKTSMKKTQEDVVRLRAKVKKKN